ncbi:hypothetical protein EGK74_13940, partial [Neisseria weixii]
AHGVIAAATSAAGDHNALTAAISAGGAEAAAPYVSQWLYGEKDGSKLMAEQKQTVSSVLSLGGAAVGAATGSSTADVVAGGQAVRTAVENNYLLPKDWSKYHQEIAQCQGKSARCYTEAAKALEEISKRRNRELAQACSVYGSIEACTAKQNEAKQSVAYTKQQLAAIPSGLGKPSAPILQYLDKVGADHPISDGLIAVNRLKQMEALAASPEFIKAYQSDAKVRKDFKNQVESLASIVQQSGRAKEGFMFDKEVPLTNISKLGGIRTGEVGLIPVYPEFELMGLGIGKATKTVAVKLLGNKSLKVGGREFSQTLGQRVMSTVDGEMAGG